MPKTTQLESFDASKTVTHRIIERIELGVVPGQPGAKGRTMRVFDGTPTLLDALGAYLWALTA